ncbi:hypothetical protein N7481_010800 [Penicillium waksmanii]|uniref:uncharacterized protein n=1 Tax=Penicillium waksmanii TaxID=69791 RepID=UPI0025496D4F|nr:uncharacterized protein N7481_010800 [Penicillium waksmanii]KAJ5973590.1 hypothetical protein N7481_010800 [Penicillium waksmanii]
MITPGPMKRDQFSSFYLKSYFPHTTGPGWDFDMTYSVFSTLFALPQKSQMLDIAFSALSCVFLGKNHSDQQILQYGLRLYNHAIQSMSKAISRKDYSLDIVYTCIVFQQIQSHYCPHGLDEWLVHLDGLGAIMRYYCPGSSLSGPMLSFIYGHHLKLKTVFNEFMHLSEETITWLKEPSEEPLYELTGILAESSRIYTAAYNTDISDYIAFQSLLNDCLSLEESHLDFFLRINDKLDGDCLYIPGVS